MKYYDYAATSPVDEDILETFVNVTQDFIAHPNTDKKAIKLRAEAKESVLKALGIENKELVFTSGGTEANNLAIFGVANSFESKKHFITSSYEHSSVYESFKELEKRGHEVTYVVPQKNGKINSIFNFYFICIYSRIWLLNQ